MAGDFSAKMDTSGVDAFARSFVQRYGAKVTDALIDSAFDMQRELRTKTKTVLEKGDHTGTLRRSWQPGAVYFPETDEASIDVVSIDPQTGTQIPYALIHDRGGVITPKRAKALAIPNRDSDFFTGSNKDFPSPTKLTPDKYKLLWLDKETGTLKDDKGQVAYFLRRSVKMPARYYIRDAVKAAIPQIIDRFEKLVEDSIGEGEE